MLESLQTGDTSPYANYLLAFASAFAFLCIALAFRLGRRERAWVVSGALLVLVAGVVVASLAGPGRNSVVNLVREDRFETVAGGLSGLLAALAVLGGVGSRLGKVAGYVLCLGVVGFCTMNMAKDAIKGAVKGMLGRGSWGAPASPGSAAVGEGVRMEEYASLELTPFCMARGPDGALYVGGVQDDIYWKGVVARIDRETPDGPATETLVADHLVRPHGIAFHDGDLFVARTGQVADAEKGRMVYRSTGAVTRLTDTDDDGKYELYEDVLDELPGAFGVHQTSAIAFDDDGRMYVSVGAAEDHSPVIEPHEGTILRARPDGSELEVFARGVRNPYALTFGPGGELFCTDNDADELNRGDVVYQVRQGDHLGFPYTQLVAGPEIEGVVPPLFMPGGGEVLEGLVYAPPGSLPDGFDDCFYVASLWGGHVKRLVLEPGEEGGRYRVARADRLLDVQFPLDLVVDAEAQALYVMAGYEEKKIYKVTFDGEGR
ncbi:PQQ-dependent sugar dehydrogenase [Tautonia plasticadhaerens]|uniref:Glucose/Sorbosone dehydrogenase domain-containing protein n=1 Tax=Tautonia plasticadhaerens TaxID=2527974 RepID=A0A518H2Z4_9BACT|nr:PQQ-dependent sugar dehydrogenase [Tautonia plasticadhaerens]QDV35208.1 hypothetical protein ElP_31110 [Tautonia plasticadhaerens]